MSDSGARDVLLLDIQDGESLAYNHAYENLRLAAIDSSLRRHGIRSTYVSASNLTSTLAVARRPLLVVDAFFRAAASIVPSLRTAREASRDVEIICMGRAAKELSQSSEFTGLIDHFEFFDEVAEVSRRILGSTVDWTSMTPHRPASASWLERSVIDLEATRGCEHACTFCGVDVAAGSRLQRWRPRRPRDVVDEMQRMYDRTGVARFQFVDDNFLGSPRHAPDWATEFALELRRRSFQPAFSAYARLDRTLLEVLDRLCDAGLVQVHVGVESGSDRVLQRLRKGLDTRQMEVAIRELRSRDLEVVASLIVFEQRMTAAELSESLAWIRMMELERFFSLTLALPLAGTKVRQDLQAAGIPLDVRPGHHRVPTATTFTSAEVADTWRFGTGWEAGRAAEENIGLESLMRARFSHEERLAVIDDPDPPWLHDLRVFRARQIDVLKEFADAAR